MFVPLRITKAEIQQLKGRVGELPLPNQHLASQNFYKEILRFVTDEHGVIDGSNLQNLNFPFAHPHYDVFISYSHNDEELALYLTAYLRNKRLNVFLDSTIWNSADGLLNAIDRQYSWAEDRIHYDVTKRNFTTSHVHAMLSMAMLEAIRRSECCLFIESPHSLTLKSGVETKTLSPWIYEEASYINTIQPAMPPRLLKPQFRLFSEGGNIRVQDTENMQMKAQYKIDLTNFQHIVSTDLEGNVGTGILDAIYSKYGIKKHGVL